MPAPPEIVALVQRFELHREDYEAAGYKEAQLRQEFIDPLFAALGWDMDNTAGHAEAYKDVIHEDAIKVGGGNKAPDYCFRIGSTRKFFVEAKKPAVNIKDAIDPAYQLRRYAWSAKLPLSILTDFDELAVYDCRIKPDKDDKSSTARVLYLRSTELVQRWDELRGIFSKEAILTGSFDKFAESNKKKRGTAEVDAAFLADIESWRLDLAKNLALRNPQLDQRDLNFAVQRIIDRIIFLRIAEDRGIEDYGRLQGLTNGEGVYLRLGEQFRRADDRYNSGLFHFEKEKDRQEDPDELTLQLEIDDKILREMIRGLYYPDSPYEFSVITADILGQVYEQFLGKVIKLTAGHRAQVEEKPEVRKAGGVYYTPTYIVDYIVQQTVGKLLEGKTPKQAAKLKILDPACGSGSFLIGAYQYLLDWHRDWYLADGPEKHKKELIVVPKVGPALRAGQQRNTPLTAGNPNSPNNPVPASSPDGVGGPTVGPALRAGQQRNTPLTAADLSLPGDVAGASGPDGVGGLLTIAERKRILLNNIYGVDIDLQAVEVTKLSLCLKVLEGANRAALDQQLKIFDKNRALPDLGKNIKCGNSLIGPDFYNGQQRSFLDEDERYRINVFDWSGQDGFPEIMKAGGFDAVIGNPPYIDSEWMARFLSSTREYCVPRYRAASGNWDIFCVFSERAISLCRPGGLSGMIVPNKLGAAGYAAGIRHVLTQENRLRSIRDYSHVKVFPVAVYPIVYVVSKGKQTEGDQKVTYVRMERDDDGAIAQREPVELPYERYFGAPSEPWRIFSLRGSESLIDKLSAFPRLGTVATVLGSATVSEAYEIQRLIANASGGTQNLLRLVNSGTIDRYAGLWGLKECRYLGNSFLNPVVNRPNEKKLPPTRQRQSRTPKIIIAGMTKKLEAMADIHGDVIAGKSTTIVMSSLDIKFLLGVINSRIVNYFYATSFGANKLQGGYLRIGPPQLRTVPIPIAEEHVGPLKGQHARVINLVDQMLALHEKLAATRPGHARTVLERQIAATDRQIDQLVYQLYGLTDEEIAIVER